MRSAFRVVMGAVLVGLVGLVALVGCETVLVADGADGEPSPAGDAAGDASGDVDASGAQDSAGDSAAPRCEPSMPCTGAVLLDDRFATLDAAAWIMQGSGVTIDDGAYTSPPSSLTVIVPSGGSGGSIATSRTVNGPRQLCIEACARIEADSSGFGTGAGDRLQLLALTYEVRGDGGGSPSRAGGVNLGLARLDYVFSDGEGPFALTQLVAGDLPRGRWMHVRLALDYRAPSPAFVLRVNGNEVSNGALAPLRIDVDHATLSVGAAAGGVHPAATVRLDDLRVTSF